MLHDFAQHLRAKHGEIVNRWMAAVRADEEIERADHLSDEELRDHLDGMLRKLARRLSAGTVEAPTESEVDQEASVHGVLRAEQHYRVKELVREIATLYGARPGYVGSLRLLRRMLANIAVAGVAESAHHVAVEALGGSLAAAISTRMGQGVINGLLTARVGLTAMHLCRPIAFGPENRPSLNRIRKELLSLPKQVL